MKIDRQKLQEALAIVKPGLATKELLEQTTSFAFLGTRVVTYNDELSVSHPVEGLDFRGAIKAEELYGLLSRLNKGEVDVELTKKELLIQCGRVKAGLALEREIELPIEEEIGLIEDWHSIPDQAQFAKHLKFAMQTCSGDMSQQKLTCVCVRKNGLVQGSDGFRLVQCKGKKMPVEDFLVSATLVSDIIKIKPQEISISSHWVHFKNAEGTIMSCRTMSIKYLDQSSIDVVLDTNVRYTITFPSKVEDMLERVRQIAKKDFAFDEAVFVSIEGGKIVMRAESEDTKSWVEEKASIVTDVDVSFRITPMLFDDILKETRICTLAEDMRGAKFTAEDGNWEYYIMLRKE